MDYWKNRKRVQDNRDRIHQRNLKRIDEIKNKALTKHANRWAKYRVVKIAQNLVLSNTISLEELTQLDIQYKTIPEICESITKKFGKTRLEHLDMDMISILSEMDDYEHVELIDLSSITRKQLEKGSFGVRDLVKEKEERESLKKNKEEWYLSAKKSLEEFEKIMSKRKGGIK